MTLQRRKLKWAVLILPLLANLFISSGASAQPVVGPSGMAFYQPPAPLPPGGPGNLIWYRPTTVNLNVPLPSVNAWDVLYQSTDAQGATDVVTGMVIVPTAPWTGPGSRPVISDAIGTQGMAQKCAPSLAITAGTEYDGANIIAALRKGWAVVATDYEGYTTGAIPTYIAGLSEGHAVLDIIRAARQVPGAGISPSAKTIIWGYSQGGQASAWAGQLQPSYAPDVNLVGVAAGGVPADLQALAAFANASVATAFVLDAVLGLAVAYPAQIPFGQLINPAGLAAGAKILSECAIQSLADFRNVDISTYTNGGLTLAQIAQLFPSVGQVLAAQKLGNMPVPVPVYHYHGLKDEFVPVAQDVQLHRDWCALGVKDEMELYPGDHLLTDPTATPYVSQWISDRLAGKPAPSTCSMNNPLPSSARLTPMVGDLVIPIDNWIASGSVTSAKLGISLAIPANTTLSASADITSGVLTASLSVPPINQTITVFGIPIRISAELTPTGPVTGTVGLTNEGVLSLSANAAANLTVKSVGLGFFTIPLNCHTVTPISLPLSISAPANALGDGLGISGTVTIPRFTGCGFFGPIISLVLSGPGNPFNLSAAPPPPIRF